MKPKTLWIVAIVAGLLAVFGVELFLTQQARQTELRDGPVEILVTKQAIPHGQSLSQAWKKAPVPKTYLTADAVPAENAALLHGRVARRDLAQGATILYSDVALDDDIVRRIRENMRAMAIPVSRVTSVAHMIRPQDRVDILVARRRADWEVALDAGAATRRRPPPGSEQAEPTPGIDMRRDAEVVLTNIEVLAVGSSLDPTEAVAKDYDTVTIHVTVDQAKALLAAMSHYGSWDGVTLLLYGRPVPVQAK